MKITILKYGEIKLEREVKSNYEKGVFLAHCAKVYGKGFLNCEVRVSIDKKAKKELDKRREKSHFKKGEILKKYHIPKSNPKTFYDLNK